MPEDKKAKICKKAKDDAEVYIELELEERKSKTPFEQEATGPKASPENISEQGKETEEDNAIKDDDEKNIERDLEQENKTQSKFKISLHCSTTTSGKINI